MARYMAAMAWVILLSGSLGWASPQTSPPPRGKERTAGTPGTPAKKSGPAIELIAKVVRFDPAAAWDHYSDGRFARYAGTTFEILSPERLRTRTLVVYHEAPVPQDSPFRAVGKKLRFRIQEADLDPAIQLFTGALEGIVLQK